MALGLEVTNMNNGDYILVDAGARTLIDQTNARIDALNRLVDQYSRVGAIYISADATSPAALFGGSWEQIVGRVIVGAGDGYTIGSTGGETTHTLTVDEMPAHAHTIRVMSDRTHGSFVSSGVNSTENYAGTNEAGGSQPHNNMQPYIAYYIWRRVS